MRKQVVLLLLGIFLMGFISASQFGYNYLPKESGNITQNITNNYYNVTEEADLTNVAFINQNNTFTGMQTFDRVTITGDLVLSSFTFEDLIPVTNNLYTLGNSTHRWKDLFVGDIDAENIKANYLNSTTIDSKSITSENMTSQKVDSGNINVDDNLNVSGFDIKEEGGRLVIILK